jgi:hypothetical protein
VHFSRRLLSVTISLSLASLVPSLASASSPSPGTTQQVASLVQSSTSIKSLPNPSLPPLPLATRDSVGSMYPAANKACLTVRQCVFGVGASSQVIVLYGDSHAEMWLPALVPYARANSMRIVLIWHPGCPVVQLRTSWPVCSSFRSSAVTMIRSLHPRLVLLADKNSNVVGPGGVIFTNAQWQAGLVTTIKQIQSATTRVAVVEDVTVFNALVPNCLAAYPADVQRCSVAFPNPKYTEHISAESAAASAAGAGYVSTRPWLCAKRCSPVIGPMIVDFDADHVTATYAVYLSQVWSLRLAKLLQP